MSIFRVPNTSCNLSSSTEFDTNSNIPTMHASTNITVTSGGIYSAAFTAPNLVNSATGVLVFAPAVGSAGNIIATLQENTGSWADVAGATAAIVITTLRVAGWCYFRFTTPYVFTQAAAGSYRIKLNTSGASGTTTVAADSGGSNFAYIATDNRTGAIGATDILFSVGHNMTTEITITVDGTTITIGDGTDTSTISSSSNRSIGHALYVDGGGKFIFDITASASVTIKGNIIKGPKGKINIGTVAVPYSSSYIANLILNQNAVSCNYGIGLMDGIAGETEFILQGVPKSSTSLFYTKYISGVGTAASPLVVSTAVDWSVGDEIKITATSDNATNYNESENRFIITKNSSTSYVLSATAGGAESAFTYTHDTNAYIVNLQRNIIVKTTDTTKGFYLSNFLTTSGICNIDWVRFENTGSATVPASKNGIQLGGTSTRQYNLDYSVVYNPLSYGVYLSNTYSVEFNGLIFTNGATTASSAVGALTLSTSANLTFNRCFAIGLQYYGTTISSGANNIFNYCSVNACGITAGGGVTLPNAVQPIFNYCEFNANRTLNIRMNFCIKGVFNYCELGTYGNSGRDIDIVSDSYNDVVFNDCNFGSTTLIYNYLSQLFEAKVSFSNLNGTTNKHFWYTNAGIGQSTGALLDDTTVRTADSLAVRLSPANANGFIWEFKILAKANSAVSFFGFFQKTTAFSTDIAKIELWLPGSISADDTCVLEDVYDAWQVCSVAANYTETVNKYATIKVYAISITAGAYLYCDDFYNGSNKITALDTWDEGAPSLIMFEQLGDASAIWATMASVNNAAGTMGKVLNDTLKNVKINQALLL